MAAVGDERSFRKSCWISIVPAGGRLPRRYRLRAADWKAYRFLAHLAQHRVELERNHPMDPSWLLPFRFEFRQTIEQRPCAGLLKYLLDSDSDDPIFLIAVWLLGRSATKHCCYELDRVPVGGTPQARRHLARALRRVEAWARLRELASDYPDDTFVRKMLEPPHADPFATRLDRFILHVDRSHASEAVLGTRMPLWFRDAAWTLTPPKSSRWMRMLLERIKQWVRGE